MKHFIGYRKNPPEVYYEKGHANPPDEPQFEGVIFGDGTCAVRWKTIYRSTSLWATYEDFYQVHGHPEYGTVIEFSAEVPFKASRATDADNKPTLTP